MLCLTLQGYTIVSENFWVHDEYVLMLNQATRVLKFMI